MKVICVGGKYIYRSIFARAVVAGGEECELTLFNPYTGGAEELAAKVKEGCFDFILHDFHADIGSHCARVRHTRELNPNIPIVVFTDYSATENAITEANCAVINLMYSNIISEGGEAIVQKAVAEARRLVA